MKKVISLAIISLFITSCATITNDPMTPINMSFSDNSNGTCYLDNKRGSWTTNLPGQVYVRRSDDALKFRCETEDGRESFGSIPSNSISLSGIFSNIFLTSPSCSCIRKLFLSKKIIFSFFANLYFGCFVEQCIHI